MNNVLKVLVQTDFTIEHNYKGFIAVGIDIRRRMSKPMHIL